MKDSVKVILLAAAFTTFLLCIGCSQSQQVYTDVKESEIEASISDSSSILDASESDVTAESIHLSECVDSNYSILTGELTDGVTINARVYCNNDLTTPGTGSVDTAVRRIFSPEDINLLASLSWTKISDQTTKQFYEGFTSFNQRIVEYADDANNKIRILNSYYGYDYSIQFGDSDYFSLLPNRIPWYSNLFEWGTKDFAFASGEEAFGMLEDDAGKFDISVSPVYKMEFVTPSVFETACRLMTADGSTVLPEKSWTEEDSAYWIEATQEWNGLPINNEDQSRTFDGTHLEGDQYHNISKTEISFLVTVGGIQTFRLNNIFQLIEKGTEKPLISLWDALDALKTHMDNPKYDMEILYSLSNRDVIIDQIELCYVPINQATVDPENPGAGFTQGMMDTKDGEKVYSYLMIPCWTFRVVWSDGAGYYSSQNCAVNAISGEYFLQTDYFPEN